MFLDVFIHLCRASCFQFRLESSFRSFSRPALHAAARVVQEMGKSRAAAFALGIPDIDEGVHINSFSETVDSHDSDSIEGSHPESNSFVFYLVFYILHSFLFCNSEDPCVT